MSLESKFESSLKEVLDGNSSDYRQCAVSVAEGDPAHFATALTHAASRCGRLSVRFWTDDIDVRSRPPEEEIEVYEAAETTDGLARVYAVGAAGVNGYILAEGPFQFSFPGEYKNFTFIAFEPTAPTP